MNDKIDTKQLCEIYGVTKQAVAKWRSDPNFPHEKLGYRTHRYVLKEVQEYFKNKAKKGCN